MKKCTMCTHHHFYSDDQVKKNEICGECSANGGKTYRVFVGKPKGKRQLVRPRSRWEDNIKIDLQVVGWGMACIDLAQDRDMWRTLGNEVMNL
jgi:hypothetical protein